MASSRKTLSLDLLQLNALKFYTSSNTPIPSSFVLTASGNGNTYFTSISSIIGSFFQTISVPGQNNLNAPSTNATLTVTTNTPEVFFSTSPLSTTLYINVPVVSTIISTINSIQASTMNNILNYPNIVSSVYYKGIVGRQNMSTLARENTLSNSGNAQFSSFQYNFSSMSNYINPNNSTRMYIEYYPNFTFGPVVTPSSISSFALYPEGNSSIKSVLSLSSHFMYVSGNSNVPVNKSGIQQYIPITSSYPYSVSSFLNPRVLSNGFIQPLKMEFDVSLVNCNVSLVHYISDGVGSIKTLGGNDIFRSGLETSTFVINNSINDKNSVFVSINNSGNQF
jgi:hypothetical protein